MKYKIRSGDENPPLRSWIFLLLLLCPAVITGCPLIIAGTGAGAGAYTYIQGGVKRAYPAKLDMAVSACEATLEKMKIITEEKKSSGTEIRISGRQTNGTPVTVDLKSLAPEVTEILVRTGTVGVWDRDFSEQIHANLAKRL